ncbi:MAG: DUF3179 domain-containing (seleno)protein [Saprospiraceae bacterium]
MKKLFFFSILGIILFEIANVYFIMPIPGSQEINSIEIAYFLFSWRWIIRICMLTALLYSTYYLYSNSKIVTGLSILIASCVFYYTNFKMAADTMFLQAKNINLASINDNKISGERLILGITYKDQWRAYPIQFLGYHHQVRDSILDKEFMITYCTVCRTGRVYEPNVNNEACVFRLVGMDHFNAMFEDIKTKSWWRQSTGECIVGPMKGHQLPEYPSQQMTLDRWFSLHPNSLIMQGDTLFRSEYDSLSNYENGSRKGKLTKRDSSSWAKKSWIVGLELNGNYKAYDWNQLQNEQVIYDEIESIPIVLVLSKDKNSFISFKLLSTGQKIVIRQDTLFIGDKSYLFSGKSLIDSIPDLALINSYQEYWHSWKTFHPNTKSLRK